MTRRGAPLCLVLVVVALGTVAQGGANSFHEDFRSLEYCDLLGTTAWWDTSAGEIKMKPFMLDVVGDLALTGYTCVAVDGWTAYCGASYGLARVGLGDRTDPWLMSSCSTPGTVEDVVLDRGYAFVADIDSGFVAINIVDSTGMFIEGSCSLTSWATALDVWGDRAYVSGDSGLYIVDINSPADPTLLHLYRTPDIALDVEVRNSTAFLAVGDYGLYILDVSDDTDPVLLGSYDTPGRAYQIRVVGDLVYVADGSYGLQVIYVGTPTSPHLVGYANPFPNGIAFHVAISGDYAYLEDSFVSELQVLDISDPGIPVYLGLRDETGCKGYIGIQDDYAYVAAQFIGLRILRIAEPIDLNLAGTCVLPDSALDVVVEGRYAYVADGGGDVQVVNVGDPDNPHLAGDCFITGAARAVALLGDYLLVAGGSPDGTFGFQIVDISNRSSGSVVGWCDTDDQAIDVEVYGNYALVTDGALHIIDISDPTAPMIAATVDTVTTMWGVAVYKHYALVTSSYGLLKIDIADPLNPFVMSMDAPYDQRGITVMGGLAFTASPYGGMYVIMPHPTPPEVAGHLSLGDTFYDGQVTIRGNYVYVSGDHSLSVVDISTYYDPSLVETFDTDGPAGRVALYGDYMILPDGGAGLKTVRSWQRTFVWDDNMCLSTPITSSDSVIAAGLIKTTQVDSVKWELSADNGATWQEFAPDSTWRPFDSVGNRLLWRSTHVPIPDYTDPNPSCSGLDLRWLWASPVIDAIDDVPDDQGGWVRLHFTRSGCDFAEAALPIASYRVWQRIDASTVTRKAVPADSNDHGMTAQGNAWIAVGGACDFAKTVESMGEVNGGEPLAGFPPGDWQLVSHFAATQEHEYTFRAPTPADREGSEIPYVVFCVSAHTTDPEVWYLSLPDSGYSVDNIAPAPPGNLRLASPSQLVWDESSAEDFDQFAVFGSPGPQMDSSATLLGQTAEAMLDVSGSPYEFYHVTALDRAGNESAPSVVENPYSGARRAEPIPRRFALAAITPNPFGRDTGVHMDVPVASHVRVQVFDVTGRRVRVLADDYFPPGSHLVAWPGDDESGLSLAPGVYSVRMEANGFSQVRRVVVLR